MNYLRIAAATFLLLYIDGATANAATTVNGPGSTGGGKAVVCRSAVDHSIQSVELLDLWESEAIYQHPVQVSDQPVEEQIEAALQTLKNSLYRPDVNIPDGPKTFADLLYGFMKFNAERVFGDKGTARRLHGTSLEPTHDGDEVAHPDNCNIEQVVLYTDFGGSVLVDQDLFEKLNKTNQAALIVHEVYYLALRSYINESNSVRTRRSVALAMNGYKFHNYHDFLPHQYIECESHKDQFEFSNHIFIIKRLDPASTNWDYTVVIDKLSGLTAVDAGPSGNGIGYANFAIDNIQYWTPDGSAGPLGLLVGFGGQVDYDQAGSLQFVQVANPIAIGFVDEIWARHESTPVGESKPEYEKLKCQIVNSTP